MLLTPSQCCHYHSFPSCQYSSLQHQPFCQYSFLQLPTFLLLLLPPATSFLFSTPPFSNQLSIQNSSFIFQSSCQYSSLQLPTFLSLHLLTLLPVLLPPATSLSVSTPLSSYQPSFQYSSLHLKPCCQYSSLQLATFLSVLLFLRLVFPVNNSSSCLSFFQNTSLQALVLYQTKRQN